MDISESWLRRYCNPPIDGESLAEALTMAGLEVEDRRPVAPPFSGVVVARVREVRKHPNADKLTVCEVDAGQPAPLLIVCGAPNVAPGIVVPCALPGAQLPGDLRIKATTMRGVESNGMLCSARELGLSEDHTGLMLLDADAPIGADVRDVARTRRQHPDDQADTQPRGLPERGRGSARGSRDLGCSAADAGDCGGRGRQ